MMYSRRTGTNKQTVDRAEKSFVSLMHGSLCTAAPPPPPQKNRRRAPSPKEAAAVLKLKHVLLKVYGNVPPHFFRVTVELKSYLSVLSYFFHSLEF